MMLVLALFACGGGKTDVHFLEGFSYRWESFNHRVEDLQAELTTSTNDSHADVSVIGGTSTTGVVTDLPDTCDADTCQEFPFHDVADVAVRYAWVTAKHASFGTGSADVDAVADGATTTVTIPVDDTDAGTLKAVVQGFRLRTDAPLSGGESCYDPANGWHPRHIGVALSEPRPVDGGVEVDVTASFEAGNSLEPERQCIDAVHDQAVVPVHVDVLVVAGDVPTDSQDVSYSETYDYGTKTSPVEQPDPDPATRPLQVSVHDDDGEVAVVGWSALDWRFHVGDPDDRGAYLRSLVFDASAVDGVATGHATNYSPGTQLSGFDYAFTGRVEAFQLRGERHEDVVTASLPAALDESGEPVVTSLDLDGPESRK